MLFLAIYTMGAVCGFFGAVHYFENEHAEFIDNFWGYALAMILAVMMAALWFVYLFVLVFKFIDRWCASRT